MYFSTRADSGFCLSWGDLHSYDFMKCNNVHIKLLADAGVFGEQFSQAQSQCNITGSVND